MAMTKINSYKFYLHEFHGNKFEAFLFETFDDLTNKSSLDTFVRSEA